MTAPIPHMRTSERRDLKRCPARWQWAWRQGLRKRGQTPDALWFGIGIHMALQERYKYPGLKRGKNVLKVWREYVGDEIAYVRTLLDDETAPEEEWADAGALGEAMLGGYLDKYGKDERWHVISAEQTFEIPIPRSRKTVIDHDTGEIVRDDRPLVYYNGTFDLVALDLWSPDEVLWLWDHKTAKTINTQHLSLDDQAGSYWAVAGDVLAAQGLIQPGMRLEGILYNYLRKAMPDTRPRNADGYATNKPVKADYAAALQAYDRSLSIVGTLSQLQERAAEFHIEVLGEVSKVQPAALFEREHVERTRPERRTQIQKIQNEALVADAFRTRALPIIKNPTMDCYWDCAFHSMCELQDQGGDWKGFRDAVYVKRDPYMDHRKAAI